MEKELKKIFTEDEFKELLDKLLLVQDTLDIYGNTDDRSWINNMILKIAKNTKWELKPEKAG